MLMNMLGIIIQYFISQPTGGLSLPRFCIQQASMLSLWHLEIKPTSLIYCSHKQPVICTLQKYNNNYKKPDFYWFRAVVCNLFKMLGWSRQLISYHRWYTNRCAPLKSVEPLPQCLQICELGWSFRAAATYPVTIFIKTLKMCKLLLSDVQVSLQKYISIISDDFFDFKIRGIKNYLVHQLERRLFVELEITILMEVPKAVHSDKSILNSA